MNIKVSTAAYCFDAGKLTQRSGIAVILEYNDEFNRTARRVICHPTGNANKNQAEFTALRVALMSVTFQSRKTAVVVFCLPNHLTSYLIKDESGYHKESAKYKTELDDIRRLREQYNNFLVIPDDSQDCMQEAKACADNQKPKDTRTQYGKAASTGTG